MIKLYLKDRNVEKSPEIERWLEEAAKKIEKVNIKAVYTFPDREEIIIQTFEEHYTQMLYHTLIYGDDCSVRFLYHNDGEYNEITRSS